MALQGAQRAATLTSRLLAFSRQQALEPKPIDTNRLVAGMSELLRRTLGEAVTRDRAGGRPVAAIVDANQLENAHPQSRGQCPRRHAGRRQADDRDRQSYLDEAYVDALAEPVRRANTS